MTAAGERAEAGPRQVSLRPPEEVMRLTRMGAAFPTRLSFMRSMLRDLAHADATVERTLWEMNDDGIGRALRGIGGRAVAADPDREGDEGNDRQQ